MKKRHGLVSNSSASSFIVRYKDFATQDGFRQTFIEPEVVKLLEANGWFQTNVIHSGDVSYVPDYKCEVDDPALSINFGKDVIVNQDDVILFLLEHNIPFTGTCDYGDETVIFNKDSEYFYKFYNIGKMNELEIICRHKDPEGVMEESKNNKCCEKINVQEWIKDNQWLKDDD